MKIYSVLILGFVCLLGIVYGLRQYLAPEKIVGKRYAKHHRLAQETGDREFQKWLKAEFTTQVQRTKKVGLMLASFEAVFLLLVVYYLVRTSY